MPAFRFDGRDLCVSADRYGLKGRAEQQEMLRRVLEDAAEAAVEWNLVVLVVEAMIRREKRPIGGYEEEDLSAARFVDVYALYSIQSLKNILHVDKHGMVHEPIQSILCNVRHSVLGNRCLMF